MIKSYTSLSNITKYSSLLLLVFVFLFESGKAQSNLDSILVNKEFTSLDEALKNPEDVYRLNLSNQDLHLSDSIWSKFPNLKYLSFKNDHLKQIPAGIGSLKNLEVLDLSGNDFRALPSTFINLTNLQELYLNDESHFNFKKSIPILSALPNLKFLHVENDGLKSLPKNISQISHLESLYLNNNQFRQVPIELKGLETLQYIDLHDNKFRLPTQNIPDQKSGFKIRF